MSNFQYGLECNLKLTMKGTSLKYLDDRGKWHVLFVNYHVVYIYMYFRNVKLKHMKYITFLFNSKEKFFLYPVSLNDVPLYYNSVFCATRTSVRQVFSVWKGLCMLVDI